MTGPARASGAARHNGRPRGSYGRTPRRVLQSSTLPPPLRRPYPIGHDQRDPSPAAPRPPRRDRHRRGCDRRRGLPRPGGDRLPGHRSERDPGLRPERRHRAADGILLRRAGRPLPAVRGHLRVRAAGADRRGRLRGGVGGVVRFGGGRGPLRHGLRGLPGALPRGAAPPGRQGAAVLAGRTPRARRLRALRGGLLRVAPDPSRGGGTPVGDDGEGGGALRAHPGRGLRARCRGARSRRAGRALPAVLRGGLHGASSGHGVHLHRPAGIRPDRRGGRGGSGRRTQRPQGDVPLAGDRAGDLPAAALPDRGGGRAGHHGDRGGRGEPRNPGRGGSPQLHRVAGLLARRGGRSAVHAVGAPGQPDRRVALRPGDGDGPHPAAEVRSPRLRDRNAHRRRAPRRRRGRAASGRGSRCGGRGRRLQPRLPRQLRPDPRHRVPGAQAGRTAPGVPLPLVPRDPGRRGIGVRADRALPGGRGTLGRGARRPLAQRRSGALRAVPGTPGPGGGRFVRGARSADHQVARTPPRGARADCQPGQRTDDGRDGQGAGSPRRRAGAAAVGGGVVGGGRAARSCRRGSAMRRRCWAAH